MVNPGAGGGASGQLQPSERKVYQKPFDTSGLVEFRAAEPTGISNAICEST